MKIIDLTQELSNHTVTIPRPWFPHLEFKQMGFLEQVNRNTSAITLGSHHGTHVDAPFHMIANGKTIESLPLDILVGPAHKISLRHAQKRQQISASMLLDAVSACAPASSDGSWPRRMVLDYGWGERWGDEAYYHDSPFLSEEAAALLLEKKVALLAMDTCSPDDGSQHAAKDCPVHRILLAQQVVIVENLCNLATLDGEKFTLYALPLRLNALDGGPARCIAVCEDR